MKGKFLAKVVSVILTATLVLGLSSSAWAVGPRPPAIGPGGTCIGCQVEDVTFETITPTAQIGYFTDADGVSQAVGLMFRQVGDEHRIYFSLLDNEEDIGLFRRFATGEEMREQSGVRGPGLAKRLPTTIGIGWGSWISWNGWELRLYFSHDLAAQVIMHAIAIDTVIGIVGLICAYYLPPAVPSLALLALLTTLTAGAIDYWDERGAPGFYVCATSSPPRAWIEP